ncbi:MAG: (2Fe-2S)-binding protein [Deltaproteobacteria bacterium]|nr:(2Fe-2S)-binding protein [Deltaproteobacteria bacterium]
MSKQAITLTVNGVERQALVEPNQTLTSLLREELGLTGTKHGCGVGDCGCCTVILDNETVNSCLVLAVQAQGRQVQTIESLAQGGELHPLQQSFVDAGAIQCGFCTPGMILSAKVLLESNPKPSREEITKGLSGNLCRCTGYEKIVEAVQDAADKMSEA